jgi:cell shape-determining protein MreD
MITKFSRLLIYPIAIGLAVLPVCFISFRLRADILPDLALGVVYFCALERPVWISFIFIYGLFISEVYGYPPGLESLLLVLTYALCAKYRMIFLSKEPLSIYAGFTVIALAYGISKYAILSLYYSHLFDYGKAMMQMLTTILFYPALHLLLKKIR